MGEQKVKTLELLITARETRQMLARDYCTSHTPPTDPSKHDCRSCLQLVMSNRGTDKYLNRFITELTKFAHDRYPSLADACAPVSGWRFAMVPDLYVNDALGKDAILHMYDRFIEYLTNRLAQEELAEIVVQGTKEHWLK